MKYKALILGIILVLTTILIGSVSAYFIDVDYAYVRSDSFVNFAPTQYSNYYDNIDFSFGIYSSGFSTYIPVVVSPVIYGIPISGSPVFVEAVPSQTFYVYPYTAMEYVYNNMFYFDADYLGYEIVLNAQTLDGQYATTESAYVYYDGTYTGSGNGGGTSNPPELVNCSKFSLSGQTDIYLDEDDEDTYNFYIINSIDEPLDIISITTTEEPAELDVDDITYPYTINGYATRSAQIDLIADTVSDDYSGFFDIYVVAEYGDLTCEKTYTVDYHIEDEENQSTADCDDIDFDDLSFTMFENEKESFEIIIENNSFDYEFDIDDVDIKDGDFVDAEVLNYSNNVNEDSTGKIKIRFDSDSLDYTKTDSLELKVKGYMTRQGREDKSCRKTETVKIKVLDNQTGEYGTECEAINIYAPTIAQLEDTTEVYSKDKGFYIYNSSNQKFKITNVSITDNTALIDISKNNFISTIYPASTTSLNFDLKTSTVNTTQKASGKISITGTFDNGATCSYSNINKSFNISILDTEDQCGSVGIINSSVSQGSNVITVYNNTNQEFSLLDILVYNNQGPEINIIDNQKVIPASSSNSVRIGVSGFGTFELLVKGKFKDGKECDYTQTNAGVINTSGNNNQLDDSCEFSLSVPSLIDIKNSKHYINLEFTNPSSKSGVIEITTDGALSDTPVLYLSGNDSFSKDIRLTNFDNPLNVYYKVRLSGCDSETFTTKLVKDDVSNKIILTSHPSTIKSLENKIFTSVQVNNAYTVDKDVTIKLVGLPNDWEVKSSDSIINIDNFESVDTKNNFTINQNQTVTINFAIDIPDAENIIYKGHFRVFEEDKLVSSTPITIDRTLEHNYLEVNDITTDILKDLNNTYEVNFSIKNILTIDRAIVVEFDVPEDWVVQGNTEVTLIAEQDTEFTYNLTSPTKISKNQEVLASIKDIVTGNIISEELIILNQSGTKHRTTALFSFTTVGNTIATIVLIIIVIAIVWYAIDTNVRNRRKRKKNNLEVKKQLKTKITDY